MCNTADSRQANDVQPVLPDDLSLAKGLASLFKRDESDDQSVLIRKREPNPHSSTYPSEIVTCQLGDIETLTVFCKYSRPPSKRRDHRHGITYEGLVYETLLQQFEGSVPAYYGTFDDKTSGTRCLAIEHLDGCLGISLLPVSEGLIEAASWLGRFHRHFESKAELRQTSHLNRYDANYFQSWTTSSSVFSRQWLERFPELQFIFANLGQLFELLLGAIQTSIHGEFYPKNVLVRGGNVFPIDWESMACGAGEIDLAALTEGWPPEAGIDCKKAYIAARWPTGAPLGFEKSLNAARVYWHLTWLGDIRLWDRPNKTHWRFKELLALAEQLRMSRRVVKQDSF